MRLSVRPRGERGVAGLAVEGVAGEDEAAVDGDALALVDGERVAVADVAGVEVAGREFVRGAVVGADRDRARVRGRCR